MKRGKIVTFSIVLLNILAFIANLVIGGGSIFGLFLSGGGYVKEYGEASFDLVIRQGQWWRLLTCGYLHMGIVHLAGNMVALKMVGASLGIFVLLGMACVWCRKGQEKQRVCFSLAEKRYFIIYTIVGCFLGIGTIVVHAIGFLIGMSVGGIYGKILYSRAKSE